MINSFETVLTNKIVSFSVTLKKKKKKNPSVNRVGWRWKTLALELGQIGSFMDLLWLLKFSLKLEAEALALILLC